MHHDRNEIRTRLLSRLGIQKAELNHTTTMNKTALLSATRRHRSPIPHSSKSRRHQHRREVELTGDKIEYTVPLEYMADPSSSPPRQSFDNKKPSVSFHERVAVLEIPCHLFYDESTRQKLWSSIQEIQENADRNSYEFLVDGGPDNWETGVKEEDEFLLWHDDLIHPATHERYQQEMLDYRQERTEFPAMRRGEGVLGEFSSNGTNNLDPGGKTPTGESSNSCTNSRKRKNEDMGSALRRSPKVSSFIELSDTSDSDNVDDSSVNDQ